jgi:hypothetical protein
MTLDSENMLYSIVQGLLSETQMTVIRIKIFLKGYADIKRIKNQFKEELGQGAFGPVFKGKISNEVQVAAKFFNTSTGNGQYSSMKWKQCVKFTTSTWLTWLAFV